MAYPSTLDSFLDPQPTDPCLWHADLHVAINTAIKAIQAKLWIDASAVTWTVDYLLKQAVSPWHTHVKTEVGLSNVTNNAQVKKISSSTNNQLVVWDWTTGDLLKDWPSYAETGAGKLALIKNTWLLDASLIDISGSTASQAEAEAWTDNTKLMTALRVAQWCPVASTSVTGKAQTAQQSDVTTWTDTAKYVTPKILSDTVYWMTLTASDTLQSSADTERIGTTWSYVKVKEIQLWNFSKWWTIRVKVDVKSWWGYYLDWYVYVNWVQVWSNIITNSNVYITSSQDISATWQDKIQFYVRHNSWWLWYVYVRNFRIYYTVWNIVKVTTVNLD